MLLQETANLYRCLQKKIERSGTREKGNLKLETQFKVCFLHITTLDQGCQQQLKSAIGQFRADQGWLTFQSEVYPFRGVPDLDRGFVMYGEMANAKGRSLHIAENGMNGWTITVFEEFSQPEDGSDVLPCLVESFSLIKQGSQIGNLGRRGPERLAYSRYWRLDDKNGAMPWVARFTGFSHVGGKS